MVSKSTLLNSFLLASTALAVPSSRLEDRLARRRENRQSQLISRVESHAGAVSDVIYSSNWAGAVLTGDGGTFTGVSGTFVVPTLSGSDGSASAWVGIDGGTCENAILQTGIDFTINNGIVSYNAWYEWFPDNSNDFSDLGIAAGDVIMIIVTAWTTTSGGATIQNLSTGQTVHQDVTSSYALCEQNAEWIIEDFEVNDNLVPFADFGTVTFTSATATDFNGYTYTPTGATIIDIEQNNQVLTSVSTSGDSVTIQYI